jgi:hypothetical protein
MGFIASKLKKITSHQCPVAENRMSERFRSSQIYPTRQRESNFNTFNSKIAQPSDTIWKVCFPVKTWLNEAY